MTHHVHVLIRERAGMWTPTATFPSYRHVPRYWRLEMADGKAQLRDCKKRTCRP